MAHDSSTNRLKLLEPRPPITVHFKNGTTSEGARKRGEQLNESGGQRKKIGIKEMFTVHKLLSEHKGSTLTVNSEESFCISEEMSKINVCWIGGRGGLRKKTKKTIYILVGVT